MILNKLTQKRLHRIFAAQKCLTLWYHIFIYCYDYCNRSPHCNHNKKLLKQQLKLGMLDKHMFTLALSQPRIACVEDMGR